MTIANRAVQPESRQQARRKQRTVLRSLREPKVAVMLMLGFSSGLPFFLSGNTLGYWLRDAGTALAAIGFISWVGLAYSLKFLWAPIIDRVDAPIAGRLGRRRGWMLVSQLSIALGLLAMSMIGLSAGLVTIGAFALIVAFSSATQDIVVDAWRIEAASNGDELGLLSSAYQLGYRSAILITDALILIMANHFGWPVVRRHGGPDDRRCCRDIVRDGTGARRQERVARGRAVDDHSRARDAVVGPFTEFFRAHGSLAVLMLAMISFYQLPEFVMGPMANPYYHDLGLSKDVVGAVRASIGPVATVIGIAAGGFAAVRFGYLWTLVAGVIIKMLVIANFAVLVLHRPRSPAVRRRDVRRQFRGRVRGRRASDLHVEPDERRLHGDAVPLLLSSTYPGPSASSRRAFPE